MVRTREEQQAADTASATKVFETAELLESILLELNDTKTLLLSQRVNKTFRDTIAGSVKLQRALFFEVDPTATTITRNTLVANVNRVSHPMGFGITARSPQFDIYISAYNNQFMKSTVSFFCLGDFLASGKPTGSWAKMLVAQGPCRIVSTGVNYFPILKGHEAHRRREIETCDMNNVTFGQLLDALDEKEELYPNFRKAAPRSP